MNTLEILSFAKKIEPGCACKIENTFYWVYRERYTEEVFVGYYLKDGKLDSYFSNIEPVPMRNCLSGDIEGWFQPLPPLTAQERALLALDDLVKSKRVSKTSYAYRAAYAAITTPGFPVVVGKNTGSGRFSSSCSWAVQTAGLLNLLRVPFEQSNVAPNGGKHGDRITVTF